MSSPFQSHWDVLTTAAKENEVTALYKSIQDDPEILNKINDIPFVDTPLHVAAANGNTLFAVETMAIMPSFCKKLNGEALSPLHVALQNGRLETARHMVKLDSGLVRVGGRGKMTPMHYLVSVTKNGDAEKLEVLIDFLTACPEAVKDVTVECKTPMHVAIDSRSFEAFGVMFGWLWRTGKINLLYMEDINGNSALRLAAEAEQTIKYTQQSGVECPKIIRKAFKRIRENTKEIIASAKAKEGLNRLKFFLSPETPMQKLVRYSAHVHKGMSMEIRNVVLVVAVLVATAVYQATLTPPNAVLHTKDPTSSNIMLTPSPITKNVHYKHHFTLFVTMNTLAFNLALGVMLFVLPFVLYSVFLHLALYFMSVSFLIMLHVTGGEEHKTSASVLMYISLGLFGVTYCARLFIASLKTVLWTPWWIGKPYRVMCKLIGCMGKGMQNSFQELQLQMKTVGWSGDPHGSYYRQ
ncbi:ankyrin repeat-containing protein BDA1-like [Ipomoea triloba]|uniref:ankyrin repeat-containing protein BDA1-like n=1 Tax=Ipomoea triloba TaxID=35885 RepID=UPI00125D22E3|nr:ankyrin repeat-containing protein BDA1-like [Ipomoea triloba]